MRSKLDLFFAALCAGATARGLRDGLNGEREQFVWAAIFALFALYFVARRTGWIKPEDE